MKRELRVFLSAVTFLSFLRGDPGGSLSGLGGSWGVLGRSSEGFRLWIQSRVCLRFNCAEFVFIGFTAIFIVCSDMWIQMEILGGP